MIRHCIIGGLLAATATMAFAAAIRVPDGAQLALSSGDIRAACADLGVDGLADAGSGTMLRLGDVAIGPDGVLAGGSGRIDVGGDWRNLGTFLAQTGTVAFVDGCAGSTTLAGDLQFHGLEFRSSVARSIVLPAGRTVTVSGHLHVDTGTGAPAVASSSSLQPATICLLDGATANVSAADLIDGNVQLQDNGCAGGGVAPLEPLVVSTLSAPSIIALIALLLALGLPMLHRRTA